MTVGATIKVESKGMSMMEISGVRDDDDGETAKEERRGDEAKGGEVE
jgi:hypothetical protein